MKKSVSSVLSQCNPNLIDLFSPIIDAVLQSESTLYSDILQLDETESDHLFPLRVPAGLAWLEQTCSTSIPTFVAKASPTVFVHRDALLQQLDSLPSGIHGQNGESTNDFFLIKGADSIEAALLNMPRVVYAPVEQDLFVTHVLADVSGLARFDSFPVRAPRWRHATGCWLVQHAVFPDLSVVEFEELWSAMTEKGLLKLILEKIQNQNQFRLT